MKTALIAIVVIILACVAVFFGFGRERTWEILFGPADLGPVNDFADLKRPKTPNTFLACPREVCVREEPDLVPPVFAADPHELRQALRQIIEAEPRVEHVAGDADGLGDRYIQRTRFMRFPDTIVIRYLPVDVGRTTLVIYSRSKIGSSDYGVNEERVRRWLRALELAVPPIAAA
ncbi:uncharacterized protein (DUF1499 family) [Breoghania corrubedonensis]|uniref:Uncharacterized protein (DUF1499 family) n=1 Tax=Breoghania corrubedonensis TaxID=665038 RepID=A0A2T5V5S9_9HYPH|nr:DUF1499 domain-containing protein [Breoghania corrubedonensis]PTW59109.1 uncharacterized protein (DUF1499 family) [Breoghania corrubedonensis]